MKFKDLLLTERFVYQGIVFVKTSRAQAMAVMVEDPTTADMGDLKAGMVYNMDMFGDVATPEVKE